MAITKNTFYIKVADIVIEIHSIYENCIDLCKDYLCSNSDRLNKPDLIVDISYKNIMRENDESQLSKDQDQPYLYFDPGYLEILAIQRQISEKIPIYDTFLMHGAVVAYQGYGYMFSAPSGVGKSTRAQLWVNEFPGSYVLNGDKPFVKIIGDSVYVYGSPWCGKEHLNVNEGVPLKAIYLLERVRENEKNSIEEICLKDAYENLLSHVYKPTLSANLIRTMKLLTNLDGRTKIFKFCSEPTQEAVRLAYETANPEIIFLQSSSNFLD